VKNLTYLLMFFSFVYSQCDYSNESDCMQNESCEWSHNYQTMNCSNFGSSSSCENYAEYGCSWEFSWGGWQNYGSSCVGGSFQVDNGFCQEVELPDCSELDQNLCNHPAYGEGCEWVDGLADCEGINSEFYCNNNNCDWVEDIDFGYCSEFDQNSSACDATPGCYGAYQYPGWYSGWYCAGGTYQIDNSYCEGESGYCEETIEYQMGDINQDGNVDILDIVIVVDAIINGGVYIAEADMNNDGSLNILDAVSMVGVILDS